MSTLPAAMPAAQPPPEIGQLVRVRDRHWAVTNVQASSQPPDILMGVSVEAPSYLPRLNALRTVPAAVRFVSFEPLLADLGRIDLEGIDWAIVGGESGPRARPMREAWVTSIRDQCVDARVPFFFKQWGGARKKQAGRRLQGRTWEEMPTARRRLVA